MTRTITKEKRIIGQRIKYFRELRGMSQIELNRLAGYKGRGMMGFIEEMGVQILSSAPQTQRAASRGPRH